MKSMKKGWIAGAGAIGGLIVSSATTFAINAGTSGGSTPTTVTLVNPLNTASFSVVANNVISFLATNIAIPLTAIMVLVGAFQMMTSNGDPEKFGTGRKTLTYAAIGFAVALLATGVTSLIQSILNGS